LAQEAVSVCIKSLCLASQLIERQQVIAFSFSKCHCLSLIALITDSLFDCFFFSCFVCIKSKIDGQLFLIKYLVILKEQILPFGVSLATKEKILDFSHIKGQSCLFKTKNKTVDKNVTNYE
jgi:hypothetical protein